MSTVESIARPRRNGERRRAPTASISKESPAITGVVEMVIRRPDRKSGSAGMPRPISYAVFCLKKKTDEVVTRDAVLAKLADETAPDVLVHGPDATNLRRMLRL